MEPPAKEGQLFVQHSNKFGTKVGSARGWERSGVGRSPGRGVDRAKPSPADPSVPRALPSDGGCRLLCSGGRSGREGGGRAPRRDGTGRDGTGRDGSGRVGSGRPRADSVPCSGGSGAGSRCSRPASTASPAWSSSIAKRRRVRPGGWVRGAWTRRWCAWRTAPA